MATAATEHTPRSGGLVLCAPGRLGDGSAVYPALGELRVRPRGAGRDRRRRQVQSVRDAAGRVAGGCAVRAVLFFWKTFVRLLLLLGLGLVVSVGPTVRRSDAQDTSAIDRGVRIG